MFRYGKVSSFAGHVWEGHAQHSFVFNIICVIL